MQTYTIKKVSVETDAGYIYNFEDLPQDNLYLKICNLFLPSDRQAIKRGQDILQDSQAQLNIETLIWLIGLEVKLEAYFFNNESEVKQNEE